MGIYRLFCEGNCVVGYEERVMSREGADYGGRTMEKQFERTVRLIGGEAVEKLKKSHVAVFGIGGVGGYAVEALARAGIGTLTLVDHDTVSESNLNRQIIALHSTIGKYKVEVMAERIRDINPSAIIFEHNIFYLPETANRFDFASYDYIVDAIDTVAGKLQLIEEATRVGTPIISSMGTGNKLESSRFEVADIYQTSVCPLAKVMRHECRKRNIRELKVVYSKEEPCRQQSRTPASISFVPPAAGLLLAEAVIQDFISGLQNTEGGCFPYGKGNEAEH